MYVEKKTISGKKYFYLKESRREGRKVKTRTLAYLGKSSLSKTMLQKKIAAFKVKEAYEKIFSQWGDVVPKKFNKMICKP